VRTLARAGLRDGRTASKALGYRQVLASLAGETTDDQARAATVAGTRRFARKQLGWFRRDARIQWHEAHEPGLPAELTNSVIASWRTGVGE